MALAYVSPYLVVSPGGNYTKHIYAGSQRIASRLANGTMNAVNITKAGGTAVNYTTKRTRLQNALIAEYDSLGAVYTAMPVSFTGSGTNSGNLLYFYHPDHLGSSSLVTNADGAVTQHVEYVPFGEVFIEERNNTWNTPYLFNAKELDEETGLYYYGARYYDPKTSVWLSVDPLAEDDPNVSSYTFSLNNPVRYIDPDGRQVPLPIAPYYTYQAYAAGVTLNNPTAKDARLINVSGDLESLRNKIKTNTQIVVLLTVAKVKLNIDQASDLFSKKNKKENESTANSSNSSTVESTSDPNNLNEKDNNRKGGGKNERKINEKRESSWKQKEQDAMKRLDEAKKNGATKAEKVKIQKEIDHARLKQRTSEPHGVSSGRH